jgi:hypothetical protein
MTSHELDRAIDALARKQHGAFSQTQAKCCGGGTDRMIHHRRETGRWIVLDDLVDALPGNAPTSANVGRRDVLQGIHQRTRARSYARTAWV